MHDDDGMPSLAYYADALGTCEHESCAVAMSRMIWLDMAEFWSDTDTRWLLAMISQISTRRAVAEMNKPGRLARFWAWVQQGL